MAQSDGCGGDGQRERAIRLVWPSAARLEVGEYVHVAALDDEFGEAHKVHEPADFQTRRLAF